MCAVDVGDATLPKPTGPHPVGFTDIEFCARGGRTILARLFYPAVPDAQYTRDNRGHWLPSPQYHPAYGHYLRMPAWLAGPVFRYLAGHVQVWAIRDAPVLQARPDGGRPFVVFSHGLGGIRTTYSTLCTELASHGFLVGAVEHRDGSAAMSVDRTGGAVVYRVPPVGHEFGFRNQQLGVRVEEVGALIKFVLRRECEGAASAGAAHVLDGVCGPRPVLAMGHSMGAATVFTAAQRLDDPECRIDRVVGLDPWMYPLPVDTPAITTPAIALSLQHFEWPENSDRIKAHLGHQPLSPSCWTIEKADHADQSDVTVVMPRMMRWRLRTPGCIEPESVLRITNSIVLSFFANGKVSQEDLGGGLRRM